MPAEDLLVAGAQFQKAADALGDHPLRASFEAAADRLLEVGVATLDQR